MGTLPTGTVTFVFTDIEGSTAMLQRLGDDAFLDVLEAHNSLMRQAFAAGVEVRTEGDSFFYVFSSAPQAVAAAISAQRALSISEWPDGGSVRVRMGMHTGEGRLGGGDYVGLDVHRAARIAAAGHGGQVLLSAATREITVGELGAQVTFRDLGAHHFKDLEDPEHVFEATTPDLPADHPPIRSRDARPNNLPAQPSEFIGRSREVGDVGSLLAGARLVTLTGPGGTGKTRLAVKVAADALGTFEHGVVYVPLDALRDPALVAPAIATALGLEDEADRPAIETVASYLDARETLLVLDNFEHVTDAAPEIGALLAGTDRLKILVTSQSVLRLRGERVYHVPPLSREEAIALFAATATATDPRFTITAADRELLERLISALDSMPLAVELAAARARLFGLRGLLERVTEMLEVDSGMADAPERQRTLRAAMKWSYGLLDEEERAAFRRLGIFDGGFTLDAAEAVAGDGALTTVASLIDKSLLRSTVARGEARFSMLDSIRRFALDRLAEAGEREDTGTAHGRFYGELSRTARPILERAGQEAWLDRLAAEHDNMRAALRRAIERAEPDDGLFTAGAAWRYFHRRGHLPEGREWLERLLAIPGASAEARVEALYGLASITYWQGNYDEARRLYEEALEMFRASGDKGRVAETLFALSATVAFLDDLERAAEYGAMARKAYEDVGSLDGIRRVVAMEAFRTWRSGALPEALELWHEARTMHEDAGDTGELLQIDVAIAAVTFQLGHVPESIARGAAALEGMLAIDDVAGAIMVLDFIGSILSSVDPERGLRLAGAASRLRSDLGGGLTPQALGFPTPQETALEFLAPDVVDAAWSDGAAMTFDEAIAYGREIAATHSGDAAAQ